MRGTILMSLNEWCENKNANCKYLIFAKYKWV
jgi:hypothetical protein